MIVTKTATRWLFIAALPFLLLTASISSAVNCPALYRHGFTTYDISLATGFDEATLDEIAVGLIHYFNAGDDAIDITVTKDGASFSLFNGRETGHLKDVKGLFRFGYAVLLGTLVYAVLFLLAALVWWKDRRALGTGLLFGGGLTLVLMAVFGIIMAVDFNAFFLQFHLLSFANDLWLLNPATDYLIMLFPEGFWFDAAFVIAAGAAGGALLAGLLGWFLRKTERAT